jgi:sugar phosphate permease
MRDAADLPSIGNARIAGMDEDLDLDSNRYSVALVVFFVSYVVFEVPSNMILSRTRPSIYLPGLMAAWGVVTIGMGFVKDYQSLVALRFVVGLLEAGFAPGVLLLISSWYKKKEQSPPLSCRVLLAASWPVLSPITWRVLMAFAAGGGCSSLAGSCQSSSQLLLSSFCRISLLRRRAASSRSERGILRFCACSMTR